MKLSTLIFAVIFTSCTSVNLVSRDGKNTMSGSMSNGSMSYSEGAGCAPAAANPGSPLPVQPTPLMSHQVCDANGTNCKMMLMADAPPTCYTQVATVKGVDLTTYAAWALAAGAAIAAMVIIGT